MISFKASSFVNPIIRFLHHPSSKAPTRYLAPITPTKLPKNPIFYVRGFSTSPKPKATRNITVPGKVAYVIERNGKYLKTLYPGDHKLVRNLDEVVGEYYLSAVFELRVSTTGSASADESWAKGEKLDMELEAYIGATIADPDVTFTRDKWDDFDLRKDVQVTEIIERTIQKVIWDENIPRLIEKSTKPNPKFKNMWEPEGFKKVLTKEMIDLGVMDELNEVIRPRYGFDCHFLEQCCWDLSPAFIKRLFGEGPEEVWSKKLDLTIAEVKSSSENILRMLEEMKVAEHRKGEELEAV